MKDAGAGMLQLLASFAGNRWLRSEQAKTSDTRRKLT